MPQFRARCQIFSLTDYSKSASFAVVEGGNGGEMATSPFPPHGQLIGREHTNHLNNNEETSEYYVNERGHAPHARALGLRTSRTTASPTAGSGPTRSTSSSPSRPSSPKGLTKPTGRYLLTLRVRETITLTDAKGTVRDVYFYNRSIPPLPTRPITSNDAFVQPVLQPFPVPLRVPAAFAVSLLPLRLCRPSSPLGSAPSAPRAALSLQDGPKSRLEDPATDLP